MPETMLPIDAYVVRFDKTHNFLIADEDQPYISKIHSIYFFDRSVAVHCCEITPSYELMHLYDEIEFSDDEIHNDSELVDRLDQKYAHEGGDDVCYIHCHSIDAMIEKNAPWTVHHYGDTQVSYDKSTRDEQIEGLREYFNGNHVL